MCSGVNRVSIFASPHLSVDRVRVFAWTKSAFRGGSVNHAASPKLYRSYYPYRSRELVSPVCGIFHCRLHSVRVRYKSIIVYNVQYTVYSIQCKVYSAQCTVHSVQYTVYSVQCTVYSVHFPPPPPGQGSPTAPQPLGADGVATLHKVHCTMYSVHCTLYIVHCRSHKPRGRLQWGCGTLVTPPIVTEAWATGI